MGDRRNCELERDIHCCIRHAGEEQSALNRFDGKTRRQRCCKQASVAVQNSHVCMGSRTVRTNCTGDELERVKCCTCMGLGGSEVCCQEASAPTQDTKYCRAALGKPRVP